MFLQDSLLTGTRVNVHPLVSTRTLNLVPDDRLKILRAAGHEVAAFVLPRASVKAA